MDAPSSAATQEPPSELVLPPFRPAVRRWPRNDLFLYVLLIALTMVRIGTTWRVFSQTTDEPIHFLSGYVWLAERQYTITPDHPPLARVVAALPLWLSGAHDGHERDFGERINRMLLTGNRYEHNLALIRCGNLVFVLLGICGVAFWSRRVLTPPFAFLATALFASLPPVLAHGGLATTDMAACGTFAIAIVAFYRWLETRSPGNALLLGVAVGLGTVSKFSFLPFFGAAALVIALVRFRTWTKAVQQRGSGLPTLVLTAAVTVAIILATYRGEWQLFIQGLRMVAAHAKEGHTAYLFGRRSQHGWWYYFPVALLFKTPLPFLVLAGIGSLRRHLDAVMVVLVLLAIAMSTPINIGIRHLLPIFVPMAVLAGAGAERLWTVVRAHPSARPGRLAAGTLLALCAWMFAGTLLSHPDYIPWFNELALGHGERILADSNFDWGQDVLRLRKVCRERHIESLAFEVFTGAPLDEIGLPPRRRIWPPMPTAGWHAISETVMTAAGGEAAYAYVTRHPMVCRAGKTIRLYYVK